MTSQGWQSPPSLIGPDTWTFLHSADVCGGKWGQRKWTQAVGKSQKKSKIYFDKKPHALLFFKDSKTNTRRPHPLSRTQPTPPHPTVWCDIKMHEISPPRFLWFYSFFYLWCMKKPCKNVFALKFEVSEYFYFEVFVFFFLPQNSYQNQWIFICTWQLIQVSISLGN